MFSVWPIEFQDFTGLAIHLFFHIIHFGMGVSTKCQGWHIPAISTIFYLISSLYNILLNLDFIVDTWTRSFVTIAMEEFI
jgi:hypothetical protein